MSRLWRLFRGNFHRDLEDEMQEHLREKIEEFMDQGMSEPEARNAARRRFGNSTFLAEQSPEEWTVKAVTDAWRDLRYAVRLMRRGPAFAVVAVVCLALGIGANAVIFAVVDHVLLRPLPYSSPDRLVAVWTRNPSEGRGHGASSAADFYDWLEHSPFFESLSAYASWPLNLTNVTEPMRLDSDLVSPGFFRTLGVSAETGRTFAPDEDQPGKDSVVVISHRLWRELGSPAGIVGGVLTLNRAPASVIGVMPASFQFLDRKTDLWMPLALSPQNRANREGRWLNAIARLAPHVSQHAAERDFAVVADRLAAAFPATNKGLGVGLAPLLEEYVGQSRTAVLVMQAAVAFLLLITCANLANLLLARAAGRSREMALRAALGASRAQIVRQLGIESGMLAALGGALGLALAHVGVRAVSTLGESVIPRAAVIVPASLNQHGESHWRILRVVVLQDVEMARAQRPCWGAMFGPQAVNEQWLAERALDPLPPGAVIIGDRNFGIFATAYAAHQRGHQVVIRLTADRAKRLWGGADFAAGGLRSGVAGEPLGPSWRGEPAPRGSPPGQVGSGAGGPREEQAVAVSVHDLNEPGSGGSGPIWKALERRDRFAQSETDGAVAAHIGAIGRHDRKELLAATLASNLVRMIMMLAARNAGLHARQLTFTYPYNLVHIGMADVLAAPTEILQIERMERIIGLVGRCKLPNRRKASLIPARRLGAGCDLPQQGES